MSNRTSDGVDHTVTQGGIKMARHLEADGRGIVGTIKLTSQTAEPTLVEVAQQVPADLSVESMAFKPDASPEFKQISEDMITLRQTVAEESVQLVFGIMLTEPPDELAFAPPTINAADPAGATRASPTTDDINRELEAEVGSELAGDGRPADADADPDESSSGPDSARSGAAADGGSDLEHRESPEADEPATTDTERRSTELRVDRLSARVEEFATYAEALEPFLDEHGTAPEFVDRVESRVNDIDERVTDTRNDLEMKLDEEAAAIRAELSTETTDLRSELEETRSEVAALRDDLGTVQEDVTALREEIAALSEDVGELTEMRESMATALSNGPLADPQPTVMSGESND
jgi:prefoldin subunit 5